MMKRTSYYSREAPEGLEISEEEIEAFAGPERTRGPVQEESVDLIIPELNLKYPKMPNKVFQQNLKASRLPGKPEGISNETWLAFTTSALLGQRNPGLFGDKKNAYAALRKGEVDFLPEDLQRPLNDEEILRLFLRNPDNKPMREGSFGKGFGKQILPSSGGLAAGIGAAKLGMKAQSFIPAAGPQALFVKAMIPLGFGIAGSIYGEKFTQSLLDMRFGEELLVAPGKGGRAERVGETAAMATAFAPIPYALPRAISFAGKSRQTGEIMGAAQYLENLAAPRAAAISQMMQGPVPAEVSKAAFKKDPRLLTFTRGYERLIGKQGAEAADNAFKVGIREGSFVVGATGGRAFSEYSMDGDYAVPLEIAFGMAGGLALPALMGSSFTVLTNLSSIKEGLSDFIQRAKANGFVETLMPSKDQRALNEVANQIDNMLRDAGDDPEKVANTILAMLENPRFKNFTSGTIAKNDVLLGLEQDLAPLFPSLSEKGKNSVKNAIKAYSQLLAQFAKNGDPKQLADAERAFQAMLAGVIKARLDEDATRVINAADRVGTEQTQLDLGIALREKLNSAMDLARLRERSLYSQIPDVEVNVFRDFPTNADDPGDVRDIPNIFDWVDFLPVSRSGIKALPPQVKTQVDFIKEVLENSGIDISRLGKRGEGSSGNGFAAVEERIVARINRIDQSYEDLTNNITDDLRQEMDALFGSNVPVGNVDDILDAYRRQQAVVDDLMAQYRATPASERSGMLSLSELKKVRSLIANRMQRARAENDLVENTHEHTREMAARRSAEDVTADEIIDLKALIDELRFTGEPVVISSQLLSEMRSTALEAVRELTPTTKTRARGLSQKFANLAYQDLTGAIDELAGDGVRASMSAARAYSRALNDVFTRSAAKDVLDEVRTGADKIPPEELVRRLFGGGADTTLKSVRDIERIGRHLIDEINPYAEELGIEDVSGLVGGVQEVTNNAIRNLRKIALTPKNLDDPEDLKLNIENLKTWLSNPTNVQMLEILPNGKVLLNDLKNAETAYEALMGGKKQAAEELAMAKKRLLFKRLVTDGNATPEYAIADAISGGNTFRDLNEIFTTINTYEGPAQDVLDGKEVLRGGIIDWALNKSRKADGYIDLNKLYDSLFTSKYLTAPAESQASISQWLVSKNLMKPDQIEDIKQMMVRMRELEGLLDKRDFEETITQSSPLTDLTLRIVGAKVGTTASGLIGGSQASLIAASAGSRAIRSLFASKAGINNMRAFKYMMENPEILAEYLKKPRTQREARSIGKKIQDFLFSKGLIISRRAGVVSQNEVEDREFETAPEQISTERRRRGPPGRGGQTPQGAESLMSPEPRPTEPQEAVGGADTVLSVVNNNPGNLRMAGQPGAIEGEGGFAAFETPQAGLQALRRQVSLDTQERGMNLSQFLSKYAPPSENDTQRYIDFVSQKTGLDPEQRIPPDKITDIMRAIVQMEGGPLALQHFYPERFRAQRSESPQVKLPPMPQIPQPRPQPTPNPQARQQYAALFPNDSTTQLLKSGIGGLA
jgi:hypothetical protein